MRRSDVSLLLLLFHLNDGAIKGRKRIQKLVFLLKRQSGIPFGFDFKPYFYGPYSEGLADTIQLFTSIGLLKERVVALDSGFAQYSYTLTPEAKKLITKSKIRVPRNFRKEVTVLSKMGTNELVRASKRIISDTSYLTPGNSPTRLTTT
jgi:uncharacterized protein YwgA